MKKALFGYNIKETDNLFNSMQNHIDVLTGKLTNLNAELAAKGNATISNEEAERKIAQLQEKINLLEKENSLLKRDLSTARSRIEIRPEPEVVVMPKTENIIGDNNKIFENNKKVESIGKIYLAAYDDAEKIKKGAVEEANKYLENFDSIKKSTKKQMSESLDQIRNQQSYMENILNDTVQNIVKALGEIGIQSDLLLNKIEELEKSVAVKLPMPEELTVRNINSN